LLAVLDDFEKLMFGYFLAALDVVEQETGCYSLEKVLR